MYYCCHSHRLKHIVYFCPDVPASSVLAKMIIYSCARSLNLYTWKMQKMQRASNFRFEFFYFFIIWIWVLGRGAFFALQVFFFCGVFIYFKLHYSIQCLMRVYILLHLFEALMHWSYAFKCHCHFSQSSW